MYYKVGFSYNIGHHLEDWAALRLDPLIVLVVFVFSTRKSCDEKTHMKMYQAIQKMLDVFL